LFFVYLKMKRVLICDDDQDVLYLVTFVLTNIGFEVFTSTDCNEIIEKVLEIKPSVIIMDNNIPDEGGVITTQILKKHPDSKHIPVIFFTSHMLIDTLAKDAGADFYLVKPFEIKKFEKLVSKAYTLYKTNEASSSQSETA
jgi:CheY-like chemotaxis protein